MADEITKDLPSGAGGTRLMLTKVAMYVGAGAMAVAAGVNFLTAQGATESWFPVVLAGSGLVMTLLGLLGYLKSETEVKTAALEARASIAGGRKSTP